jgi:hypothetical protein
MPRKYPIAAALAIALVVLMVWAKALYLQQQHFSLAEKHFGDSSWKLAQREYDLAMHFYSPLSPYTWRSADRLWQIGEMFESRGGLRRAIIAYSSIRSSLFASTGLYTPGRSLIEKCNGKIARLNVRILVAEGIVVKEDEAAEVERFLFVLRSDSAPDPAWSLLAGVGFIGWIGSVLFLIFRGLGDDARLRWGQALWGALCFALAYAVWVTALLKA